MTAGELIDALRAVNPSTRIVVDGYEAGVTTEIVARLVPIVRSYPFDPYNGEHDIAGPGVEAHERAFLIGRAGGEGST
jgi:hypothetical protein